tara:strand:- start:4354 stop:5673 length:1320 start_codon:yes stop_codon:yes gene_type:complete
MNILIAIFSNIVLAATFYFYRRMRGLKNYYLDIWTSLLLIALITTILGINVFLLTEYELPWGLHSTLSDGIILRVYLEYYVSWCFLFLILGFGAPLIRTADMQEATKYWSSIRNTNIFDFFVVAIFLCIVFYDLYLIGNLPIYYILNGDILGAEAAKGEFFVDRMSSSIPLFGYLMQYFPLFALGWTFDRYLSDRKLKGFVIVLLISIIYSGLTLIKSYALMPVIVCLVIYLSKGNYKINLRFLAKVSAVCFSVIFIPFVLLSEEVGWPVFLTILERIFLVQIQGAFLIRSHYDGFQLDALLEGAPLVARLGYETLDPAAEVLYNLWGDVAGLININSHFVGQGFVMFGPLISIIGPIFLYLNFALLTLIFRIFSRSPFKRVANIILITAAALVPINNNFGNTVYFKSILATIILLLVVWPIYSLTVGKGQRRLKRIIT